MESIAEFLVRIQMSIGTFAGTGADDTYSVASFLAIIWLALFGAVCLNHISQRHDNVHLAFNALAMFAGGVAGNALLRGMQLPLGHELIVTATLALFGMSVAALALLFTYGRSDI
ncbi:MAG TPA: hypothetical protein VMO81_13345 [Aestuariivirgaceae bacterium]|nr:hypothetical protein [Aestuariivirgaceae bacterium]